MLLIPGWEFQFCPRGAGESWKGFHMGKGWDHIWVWKDHSLGFEEG